MSPISTRKHGDVLIVTSNNPPVNALGHAVREGLVAVVSVKLPEPCPVKGRDGAARPRASGSPRAMIDAGASGWPARKVRAASPVPR